MAHRPPPRRPAACGPPRLRRPLVERTLCLAAAGTDTEHGVRLVRGDVRGRGLEAVQLAASVLNAFRQAAPSSPSLRDLAVRLDRVVAAVSGDEDFVTAVLAEPHDDGSFDVVNCGHHPPLLLDGVGSAATSSLSTPARRPFPSAWVTRPRSSGRAGRGAGGCCSPPTASWRPVVRRARSSRCSSTPACSEIPPGRRARPARRPLLAHTGSQLGDDMALLLAERR